MTAFVLSLLCTAFVGAAEDDSDSIGTDALHDVLDSLHQYELLCENLEVEWTVQYEMPAKDVSPGFERSSRIAGHSVMQDGMHYVSYQKQVTTVGGEAGTLERTHAFDGESTRSLDDGVRGNIHHGTEKLDTHLFRPHSLALRRSFVKVPLSVWLAGNDAIRAYPGMNSTAGAAEELGRSVKLIGAEKLGDFTCLRVDVEVTSELHANVGPIQRIKFWLAQDRSYLPVRVEFLYLQTSDQVPLQVYSVADLEQSADGVWIPRESEIVIYDEKRLDDRDAVPIATEHISVLKVNTVPHYPKAFFQDVKFPNGCAVYETHDGETIERSYRIGAPETSGGTAAAITRWWLVGLNVGAAVVIGGYFSLRRWRQRAMKEP